MMKTALGCFVSCLMLLSAPAMAGSEDIAVDAPWARASIGTARPGAAYMTIRNGGRDSVTVTGIRTGIADLPEIHRTATDANGRTSMVPAGKIVIPPGEAIALEPGGLHVMLMKLKGPMKEGSSFPMTLAFDDGGKVTVEVPILGIGARGPQP